MQLIDMKYKKIFATTGADITFSHGIDSHLGDHQMGTCRMGEDPMQSVTDTYCRLHDNPDIFICDASVFPTGLGVNPALSLTANALRIGSALITGKI